jgi:hypothetical protein
MSNLSSESIVAISTLSRLKNLNIGLCNKITVSDLEILVKAHNTLFKSQLCTLALDFIKLGHEGMLLVSKFPLLQRLQLNGCKVDDENIGHLQNLKLKELNLTYCNGLTDVGLKILAETQPLLQKLYLSHCHSFTIQGIESLIRSLGCLKRINLRRTIDSNLISSLAQEYQKLVIIA